MRLVFLGGSQASGTSHWLESQHIEGPTLTFLADEATGGSASAGDHADRVLYLRDI